MTDNPPPFECVVLAAGLGTRLGRPHPKPLTPLKSGKSILRTQVDQLRDHFGHGLRITIVVGFKMDLVIEANPDACFVYNEVYDSTNTSQSLLRALTLTGPGPVLWLNGDVVFDPRLLNLVEEAVDAGDSFVCVDTATVGAEEVKYALGDAGLVSALSKSVPEPLGEAVGINFVTASDKPTLAARLGECEQQDYFEAGMERAIAMDALRFRALDISAFPCVEVDDEADLTRANDVRW